MCINDSQTSTNLSLFLLMQCQDDLTRLAAHAMIVVTPTEVNESAVQTASQRNRAAADSSKGCAVNAA